MEHVFNDVSFCPIIFSTWRIIDNALTVLFIIAVGTEMIMQEMRRFEEVNCWLRKLGIDPSNEESVKAYEKKTNNGS
jgi:hypothetical protein